MALEVIKPVTLTAAMLTSSTVLEPDTATGEEAWSSTKTYTQTDVVVSTTTHRQYRSLVYGYVFQSSISLVIESPGMPGILGIAATDRDAAGRLDSSGNPLGWAADTPISFTTTGALPTGLAVNTIYYLKPSTNPLYPGPLYYELAATPGGTSINFSGSQSGTHSATIGANKNKALTNESYWADIGPSNRAKAYDGVVSTAAVRASSVQYAWTPGVVITAGAVFGIVGSSIRWQIHNGATQVFDETQNLDSTTLANWADFMFAPTDNIRQAWFSGFPTGSGYKHTITVNRSAGNAAIGEIVMGTLYSFGDVQYSTKAGIRTFTRIVENEWGIDEIVRRPNAKTTTLVFRLSEDEINKVTDLLSDLESLPCAWRGTDDARFSSPMIINGFYGEFEMLFQEYGMTVCTLPIKGRV